MNLWNRARALSTKLSCLIEPGKRGRWGALVVLALLVSFLEATGAFLIFALVRLIVDPGVLVDLPIIGRLDRIFPAAADRELVLIFAGLTAAFSVVRGILYLLQSYAQSRIAQNAGVRMSARLFTGYLSAPYTFHLRRNTSELLRNAFYSVAEVVSNFLVPIVGLITEVFIVLGVLVALILVAPTGVGLGVLVLAPVILILLRVVQPVLRRLGAENQQRYSESLDVMQQSLQGIREVKLFQKASFFTDLYNVSRSRYARTMYLRTALTESPRIALEVVAVLFMVVFLVGSGADADSSRNVASLGVFAYAVLRAMPSLNRILWYVSLLRFGSPAVDIVYNDLRNLSEIRTPMLRSNALTISQRVEVRDVWARYKDSEEDVIRGITLDIGRGEFIGIVGPTGGGKSTLVDVIVGLLPPSRGVVAVDGTDIHDDLPSWLDNVAVISQSCYLLDDSIRRNVAFGVQEEQIDEDRVRAALHAARLNDFVESLPMRADSIIGERGVRLSGGQRQRVAIARALYKHAQLLVMDEGTSALDSRTEADLMSDLSRLREDRTVVAVAHRLTTVKNSDRIVLIEEGRVAGVGTYEELLRTNPRFGRLVV